MSEAAQRLVNEDVVDGLDFGNAKSRVATTASRGHLGTNGKSGAARRIEAGSLAKWILELRRRNLAEDGDAVKRGRRQRSR